MTPLCGRHVSLASLKPGDLCHQPASKLRAHCIARYQHQFPWWCAQVRCSSEVNAVYNFSFARCIALVSLTHHHPSGPVKALLRRKQHLVIVTCPSWSNSVGRTLRGICSDGHSYGWCDKAQWHHDGMSGAELCACCMQADVLRAGAGAGRERFQDEPQRRTGARDTQQQNVIRIISSCSWTRSQGLMQLLPSAGADKMGRCTPGAGPLPAGRRLLQHD